MKASPLILEGYYVKELRVESNPKFEERTNPTAWTGFHYQVNSSFEPDPVKFEFSGRAWTNKDEPLRRAAEITIASVSTKKQECPYYFRITVAGYFEIHENFPSDRAEMMFHANAPAILFGAAREILAGVTGRGLYPAVVLPTVTFFDDAEKIVSDLAKPVTQSRGTKALMLSKGTKKAAKSKKKAAKSKKKAAKSKR